MKRIILMLVLCGTALAGIAPQSTPHSRERFTYLIKRQIFIDTIYERSLTPELLREALYYAEVISPEIAYKQALIETGYFSSELCIKANNIFGMRLARVRPTTAIGEYKYHARYRHWWDSVKDYKSLQEYYSQNGYDLTNYLVFLKEIGYATDKSYINKLKSIKDFS